MNKIIIKHGLIVGILSILLYLIDFYIFEYQITMELRYLIYLLLFFGIPIKAVLTIKKSNNNFILYSQVFKTLFNSFIIGFILYTLFSLIFYTLIEPNAILNDMRSTIPFISDEARLEAQYRGLEMYLNSGSNYYPISIISSLLSNTMLFAIIASILSLFFQSKTPVNTSDS